MIKKKYSHGEHMAQISRMNTLYDVIIMLKETIAKQQIILNQLEKAEKEYKNVK
jgi:hypothetical protein